MFFLGGFFAVCFMIGTPCWSTCASCEALREAIGSLATGMQTYYATLSMTGEGGMAKDCLKRLEQIWEQASVARLTEQTPCKVQSVRFSVEGQTFLDTVQTLHESLLQGSSSSPTEEPWETLLERFTPPSDFERRVHAKYDTIPSPSLSSLMFQWEFFDALAGACTVFAHYSSQTACDPRTALCQSTPLETLPRLPEIFATLSQKFQNVSKAFRWIVNQKGKDEALQAHATFEEDCIERIMPCLRIQDGRPAALIPEEDRSRTFFIENKDKTLVYLTSEKKWNPTEMEYRQERKETPIRVRSETGKIGTPILFRGMPLPEKLYVKTNRLQQEVDLHQDQAQKALHEVAKFLSTSDAP